MVSPRGTLHAHRGVNATVCGIKFTDRRLLQTNGDGWLKMRGDFHAYAALEDGRTCKSCQEGLELGTGPGA